MRKRLTVGELIQELQKLPPNAPLYAYQGEFNGIVVLDPELNEYGRHVEIALIDAPETVIEEE